MQCRVQASLRYRRHGLCRLGSGNGRCCYEEAPLSQTDRLAECLSSMSTAWTWPNATRRADNARRAGMLENGTTPVHKVSTHDNPADLMTKAKAAQIRTHSEPARIVLHRLGSTPCVMTLVKQWARTCERKTNMINSLQNEKHTINSFLQHRLTRRLEGTTIETERRCVHFSKP